MKRGQTVAGCSWSLPITVVHMLAAMLALSCSSGQPTPEIPALHNDSEAGVSEGVSSASGASDGGDAKVIQLCNLVLCDDGAAISVTLPVPAQQLADARVRVWFGSQHIEMARPRPIGGDGHTASRAALRLAPVHYAVQRVAELSPSLSRIGLSFGLPPELAVDGIRYTVLVESAAGEELLNVSRVMRAVDGEDLGNCMRPCRYVYMRLYSDSRSGIACDSNPCEEGAVLHLESARVVSEIDGALVEICRNSTCGHVRVRPRAIYYAKYRNEPTSFSTVSGGHAWSVKWDPGKPDELLIKVIGPDRVMLSDGDRYSVRFTNGGTVLGRFETTVRYERWYANGEDCDTVPCSRAVVRARL